MSFASDLRRVRSRSARFEKVLEARAQVLVVSHNNPDPDSIVSALLLETLLTRVFGISVTIAYSGVIGRAENKALLEYCGIQPVPLREIDVAKFETVALVDTQPGTGNHPFEEAGKVAVVLDHHRLRPDTRQVAFFDVRDHLGSTTTLLHLYWRVWRLELTPKFATAMLYALRSETADMGRAASVVDRRLFKDLYALADLRALSRIVNAKVGERYFSAIHKAIERAVVCGPLEYDPLHSRPRKLVKICTETGRARPGETTRIDGSGFSVRVHVLLDRRSSVPRCLFRRVSF